VIFKAFYPFARRAVIIANWATPRDPSLHAIRQYIRLVTRSFLWTLAVRLLALETLRSQEAMLNARYMVTASGRPTFQLQLMNWCRQNAPQNAPSEH